MAQDQTPITYGGSGVVYEILDLFKRLAIAAAIATALNIARLNNGQFREVATSRGESAYLIETEDCYLSHVEEGLGTKSLVADAMYELTGISYDDNIAQDGVAMIANDNAVSGAATLSIAMHIAFGDSNWLKNDERVRMLINGWKRGCDMARCVWGAGETPTLKGIVVPGTYALSGSAMGIIKPKSRRIDPANIRAGDAIVMYESSGIDSNGLTMCREIAERKDEWWRILGHLFLPARFPLKALPEGYLTKLPNGRTYGETLLDPTIIRAGLVEDCLNAGVRIHYAVCITGHGWRKLMRATQCFAYIIERLPRMLPIFPFIQKHGPVTDEEAYGNLNMSADFALYVPMEDVGKAIAVGAKLGQPGFFAGRIEASDEKKVVIKPKGIVFKADTLQVR